MNQFSLFTSHEDTVDDKKEVKPVIKPTVKNSSDENKPQLVSISKLRQDWIDGFKVEECICGNKKLERFGNIIFCKKCGNEYNPDGILFGK